MTLGASHPLRESLRKSDAPPDSALSSSPIEERGENTPTLTVVFRICDALGVSPSELLDEVWRQR